MYLPPSLESRDLGSLINSIIFGVVSLIAALTPQQQNGASLLGLLTAPQLPSFLTNNPLPSGFPWGGLTASGNSPYTDVPDTGVTRTYDFTVTRGVIAPDGVEKNVILINGAFPGPTIEANWGDMIKVTVHNNIMSPGEGIGFHWHGILQQKTQWYDGVAAVSQCPVAPGQSFTYTFQADLYGSSWYHSHYSAQYVGGLFGAMVIYGPKNANYDIDLGPVLLTDYYHRAYFDILKDTLTTDGFAAFDKVAPISNNNLINGKMDYDCSQVTTGAKCTPNAGVSKFKFKKGKTHRLRLINAGADALQRFSIDGHTLTVIAHDFVPVQPYTTKVVTLGIGQRADVLVTANGGYFDSYWMRSNISTICSRATQPNALAAIYYDFADTSSVPKSSAQNVPDPGTCKNDDAAPFYKIAAPGLANGALVKNYDITFGPNASNIVLWAVNGQTFRGDYNNPILLSANAGNLTFPKEANVYNLGSNSSVIFVINNLQAGLPSHPMHLHGHNFWVLHQGSGAWDGKTITSQSNPPRRDVQMLPSNSHLVIQYNLDNPGSWPLHCHIAWHVSSGLYINTIERPDEVKKMKIPSSLQQGCSTWNAFTSTNVVDQIDSGL